MILQEVCIVVSPVDLAEKGTWKIEDATIHVKIAHDRWKCVTIGEGDDNKILERLNTEGKLEDVAGKVAKLVQDYFKDEVEFKSATLTHEKGVLDSKEIEHSNGKDRTDKGKIFDKIIEVVNTAIPSSSAGGGKSTGTPKSTNKPPKAPIRTPKKKKAPPPPPPLPKKSSTLHYKKPEEKSRERPGISSASLPRYTETALQNKIAEHFGGKSWEELTKEDIDKKGKDNIALAQEIAKKVRADTKQFLDIRNFLNEKRPIVYA
jgi:hypothetical protein